jgi:alpha-D-ribose 1-methylphosphonate 5-triphosphate diphosphatase
VLDALSSDYVPASLLLASWQLLRHGGYTLPEAIGVVSANPARACGLHDRGAIVVGQRADLVRVKELDGQPVVREVYVRGLRVA